VALSFARRLLAEATGCDSRSVLAAGNATAPAGCGCGEGGQVTVLWHWRRGSCVCGLLLGGKGEMDRACRMGKALRQCNGHAGRGNLAKES